jgi:uncharacterized protein YndB with AHSA1/START domain
MQWSTEHTERSQGSRRDVWALWSDVSTWPEWDAGVERVEIDGPFVAGSRGRLKPAGSPAVRFRVLRTDPERSFADESRLPFARMVFEHELADADGGGTVITHRATIRGPLTPLWRRLIGRGLERELPETVRTLAARAG